MHIQNTNFVLRTATYFIALTITSPCLAQTTVLSGSAHRSSAQANVSSNNSTNNYETTLNSQQPSSQKPTAARVHPVHRYYSKTGKTYWQQHPMVKGAAIGAGSGAVVGGITGLISHRGFGRGALIGAGTGAGIGVVRTSQTMKRHPVMRDVATGTLAGTGLGWAASRRGSTVGKSAGIGAALGLGAGLFQNMR